MSAEAYDAVARRWPRLQAWANGETVEGPTVVREARDLLDYLGAAPAPLVLDAEEARVMEHIVAAMRGIQDLGLKANTGELAAAVHVLQGFVIQHMLQRIAPDAWGCWYEETVDAG